MMFRITVSEDDTLIDVNINDDTVAPFYIFEAVCALIEAHTMKPHKCECESCAYYAKMMEPFIVAYASSKDKN